MPVTKDSMLKQTFTQLVSGYAGNNQLATELWNEIEISYSGKKRFYHTLAHLENLLIQLLEVKNNIQHWDTILFTLYYHDCVYNALQSDNEEKSAGLAEQRMTQMAIPAEIIAACKAQILATKKHLDNTDTDTNYFTDADLSILGTDWDTYSAYFKNVRKEYAIYPDVIYNPGRRKVLKHFLAMERIFKTDYFYTKFERQAKENLQRELSLF
jgi:predicted metal-dependent HD superfamily phosphohydrolase